jgi:predicted dehydrogenase
MALRVAVIGAGGMAREHIRAFADIPGVSVVGLHSRTRAKAEALATELNVPAVYTGIAELHQGTQADLAIVAVPEMSCRGVAEACFEHPWTLLMEKPAGVHLADAQAIAAAAADKKRQVFVALNRRFLSSSQAVVRDLSANAGQRFIHVQDQQSLAVAASIGHPPEVVRNWMFANSIHVIDLLRFFGRGSIENVTPIAPWRERAAVVLARVEFSSGDHGLYEGIWDGPGPWAATVTTPSRRWEMRPLEQAVFQNAGERKLQPAEMHEWDRTFKPGFRLQAEEVVRAIRGEPSTAVPIDQANETMSLIARIFGM